MKTIIKAKNFIPDHQFNFCNQYATIKEIHHNLLTTSSLVLQINYAVLLHSQTLRKYFTKYDTKAYCSKSLQILQIIILRIMVKASWYIRNEDIRKDLEIEPGN